MANFLQRVASCSAGAVAVISAMVFPLLLGFGSLGIEVGHWYLTQRQMQGAADAAAISAAAAYIRNISGNTYQAEGVHYADWNGFAIPTDNVCLYRNPGDCSAIQLLDARPISCPAAIDTITWSCIVVEITQNTMDWLTTRKSVMPASSGVVHGITTPILRARSIVAIKITPGNPTTASGDCILALANDPQAVYVFGDANLKANCGIAIDGGLTQNMGTPVLGGITVQGSATVQIGNPVTMPVPLTVATSDRTDCDSGPPYPIATTKCFWFNPSNTQLPESAIQRARTPDPYTASLNFTNPLGVASVTLTNPGSGYSGSSCQFAIAGTLFDGSSQTAKLTANIAKSGSTRVVTGITVDDPGAYAVGGLPSTGTVNCGGGSTAMFTINEGCFAWNGTAIAGRKYCSIDLSGTVNFPPGNFYVMGDLTGQGGVAATSVGAGATPPGNTFYFTNGGFSIQGNGSYNLCAPGTVASGHSCDGSSTTCDNASGSCMLFVQKSNRGVTTSNILGGTGNKGNTTFSGLIYIPNESFEISGNRTIGGCFGVVAQYVTVKGNPVFSNGCLPGNGIGTTVPGEATASSAFLFQ